jgi:geranylgeranyl pyrophosphate synthase
MDICAGEVRQQAIRYRYDTDVDEYMRRIEAKTATLLAACCDIGALMGGLDEGKRSALRAFGRLLGLAFQIADDVLDYEGSQDKIGKPIGQDIAEGFATLPLMLAMRESQIAGTLKSLLVDRHVLSADEAQQVVELVRASSGPQRALDRARELASEARHQLAALDGGDAGQALAALSDYVVSRKL